MRVPATGALEPLNPNVRAAPGPAGPDSNVCIYTTHGGTKGYADALQRAVYRRSAAPLHASASGPDLWRTGREVHRVTSVGARQPPLKGTRESSVVPELVRLHSWRKYYGESLAPTMLSSTKTVNPYIHTIALTRSEPNAS